MGRPIWLIQMKKKWILKAKIFFIFIYVVSVVILLNTCVRQKANWQGTVEEVGGVTVVKNPKEPMYGPAVLGLDEELSIGVVEGPEEQTFSQISDVDIDRNGNIYILDSAEASCRIFSPEGVFIRSIGRPGQGPGELSKPLHQHFCPNDQLWIEDYGNRRIAIFTTDGRFIRNISTAKAFITNLEIDSKGNILGARLFLSPGENARVELQKFSPELEYKTSLVTAPSSIDPKRKTYNLSPSMMLYEFNHQDQIVFGYPDKYELKIYNSQGNLLKKIQKPYVPVEMSQDTHEKLKKLKMPGLTMIIPDYWPAYGFFCLDNKGWIYVLTYEKVLDDYCWDVFDEDGRYFARIHLNISPVVIRDDQMYAIKQDEDGFQFVKRFKITWKILP